MPAQTTPAGVQQYRFASLGRLDLEQRQPPQRGGLSLSARDYGAGTKLALADGRESILCFPRAPYSARKPPGRAVLTPREQAAQTPRTSASAAPSLDGGSEGNEPAARVTPPTPAGIDAAAMAGNYWLPPLVQPLSSRRHDPMAGAGAKLPSHMMHPRVAGRIIPGVPAAWSLSPTPLSPKKKHRFKLSGAPPTRESHRRFERQERRRLKATLWYERTQVRTHTPRPSHYPRLILSTVVLSSSTRMRR